MTQNDGDARVRLRPLVPDDQDEFIAQARASMGLHHPWYTMPTTPEAFQTYLAKYSQPTAEGWLVCLRDGGALAGMITIDSIVRGRFQSATLSYAAFAPAAGRGYMSEGLALVLRLDRYVAGNPKALATVRVPSEAEEQKRIESRQREQLKREVQRVAAQGRSLLLSQGHREKNRWWQEKRWEDLQPRLPAWLATRLETFRRVLATLTVELAAATQALSAAAPAVRPKGVGGLTYETLEREVGDWQRFDNRRQVGSYTGLCGGVSASGNSRHQLSITKHGNARLRTALVEMAWRLMLWQPECKLVKKWAPVLTSGRATQAARKKAIIAIARQMAVDLWRWRTGRVQPEQLGWTMLA